MREAFAGVPNRVKFKLQTIQTKVVPKTLRHGNDFSVDVGSVEADGLNTNLMKLTITTSLGPFVPEHRSEIPKPTGPFVGQVMFDH